MQLCIGVAANCKSENEEGRSYFYKRKMSCKSGFKQAQLSSVSSFYQQMSHHNFDKIQNQVLLLNRVELKRSTASKRKSCSN